MELIQSIKLFSVPTWLKIFIALLLAALGIINTALFVIGLHAQREGWVKSSIDLLSVILPIFIISLLLWKSDTGISSLRRKTEEFFLVLLPSVLYRIMECDSEFFEAYRRQVLSDRHTGVRVLINLQKNDCYSDVIVLAPDGGGELEMVFRLEINVKKVNFNLCLDESLVRERFAAATKLDAQVGGDEHERIAPWVFERFKHTTSGAGLAVERSAHHEKEHASGGYQFNPRLLRRTVGSRTYLCLVASCSVDPDFLYNPAERLFFAQDTMFFLRSFLTEARDMFRTVPEGTYKRIAQSKPRFGIASLPKFIR